MPRIDHLSLGYQSLGLDTPFQQMQWVWVKALRA